MCKLGWVKNDPTPVHVQPTRDTELQTSQPPLDDARGEREVCKNTRKIPRQATSAVAFVADEPEVDDPLLAFTPYLHAAPRSNSITPERQRAFIAQLAATGIVKSAARHIGKSLEALYKLRHRPGAEGFAAAWDAALERGARRLEDIAHERAMIGTRTPIVSHGRVLGHWDKPDNALLRFLLQHRLPERYGVHNLKPGHPVYESIKKEVLAAAEREQDGALAAERERAELAEGRLGWALGKLDGLLGEEE